MAAQKCRRTETCAATIEGAAFICSDAPVRLQTNDISKERHGS